MPRARGGSGTMYAKDLKKGVKVCGHGDGWMTVKRIVKQWPGYLVEYDAPAVGRIVTKAYSPHDEVDAV